MYCLHNERLKELSLKGNNWVHNGYFMLPDGGISYLSIHTIGLGGKRTDFPTLCVYLLLLFCRYDVELYQRIEHLIGKQLPLYKTEEQEVMMLVERVTEAQRYARLVRPPFTTFQTFMLVDLLN